MTIVADVIASIAHYCDTNFISAEQAAAAAIHHDDNDITGGGDVVKATTAEQVLEHFGDLTMKTNSTCQHSTKPRV